MHLNGVTLFLPFSSVPWYLLIPFFCTITLYSSSFAICLDTKNYLAVLIEHFKFINFDICPHTYIGTCTTKVLILYSLPRI
jgi:undecaprenyl pyrophosphate phosphatase UppP